MRRLQFLLVLFAMLPCTFAYALQFDDPGSDRSLRRGIHNSEPPIDGYLCDQCRDFDEYPMDSVAFAYNGFFGDNPWMRERPLGFPFRIYRVDGTWVMVWFEDVVFDMPTLLPNLMEVVLRMPNGQVLTFVIVQGGPDLPIGDLNPEPDSCSSGGGDGGGDDDYEEPEDFEDIEIDDDRAGVVDIIDPDEDGDFPDWEEEV